MIMWLRVHQMKPNCWGTGRENEPGERMRELQQIRDSFRQKDADLQSQYQTGDISEDFYRQARAQNAQYLSERLKDQGSLLCRIGCAACGLAERLAGGAQ